MAKRLKDLRNSIQDIDQADAEFASLAKCEIEMARIDAEAEAQIAAIKAAAQCSKELASAQADVCRKNLAAYIESHPDEFTKPRKRKTDWGTYGLHTAHRVKVYDKDAAIIACESDPTLRDCLRTTITVLTSPIGKLLKAGREISGCELSSGDVALCTVKKELLDRAKTERAAA
jgi:phage host-nuclease inhibitor protein Gam